ncbi:unnamed protein product, partial [Ectocarpus sp. 12 AP-2014]
GSRGWYWAWCLRWPGGAFGNFAVLAKYTQHRRKRDVVLLAASCSRVRRERSDMKTKTSFMTGDVIFGQPRGTILFGAADFLFGRGCEELPNSCNGRRPRSCGRHHQTGTK